MKATTTALFLATAGYLTLAANINIRPLILGGNEVPIGTKQYTVGLRDQPAGGSRCGGSLITPTHVLTAGHCAGFFKHAAVGTHFAKGNSDGETIAIKKETVHPQYNPKTLDFDFTILELEKPSTFTPIKLLASDIETMVGVNATVVGWGRTTYGGNGSYPLLSVKVPIVSKETCQSAGLGFAISSTMFCAGGEEGKDACQGDSGGPIVLENESGDVLVGDVSWGYRCGVAGKPGVYGKLSVVKDWILSLAPEATFV